MVISLAWVNYCFQISCINYNIVRWSGESNLKPSETNIMWLIQTSPFGFNIEMKPLSLKNIVMVKAIQWLFLIFDLEYTLSLARLLGSTDIGSTDIGTLTQVRQETATGAWQFWKYAWKSTVTWQELSNLTWCLTQHDFTIASSIF